MYNFNQERMGITILVNSLARIAFLEAIEYAKRRKTFGEKEGGFGGNCAKTHKK